MKVSLNTIKQYTAVTEPVETLVARVNAQLGGVEEIIDIGARYKGATIVRVVSCDKHPDADKLKVCRIDDGHSVADIERDAEGYVQVVCGAPNVNAGMLVVWLPPGSTVPETFTDKEPFVLAARKLRGVTSYGMLASPKELGLGDSHDGILGLDANEWKPTTIPVNPGTLFASAYGLDDTVLGIENKMFTHRPDCFGQLGVAREIAGTAQRRFTSPAWYKVFTEFNRGEGLELTVKNQAYGAVPRFMAVAIQGVTIGPSPIWLQTELVRLGAKPINNVVDVTNYVMLLTGQPIHAYDYDKLSGHSLIARTAHADETVTLLNGKTYQLDSADIVIADDNGPIGLGGVMGGQTSEVDDATTNIVIECASFDMYSVRRTSMRHGVFTDAVTRFSKGQSSLQTPAVLGLTLAAISDTAGGSQASPVYDQHEGLPAITVVDVTPKFINDRLGLDLTHLEIAALLGNVEFVVGGSETLHVTVPFWRTDIERPEDIVEEIGRLYGFDKLPRVLPRRSVRPAPRNPLLDMKQALRSSLATAGANEVLTYSFVHERTLTRANQAPAAAFRLSNALSPDLQYYRLSVLPSLLERVR
ncbi:MAG TPA: phenylalanine--tRNA ligase subunit beta, partial [Candidatus Saccharimonadales bacterium]